MFEGMNLIFQNPRTGRWWGRSKHSAFSSVLCDDVGDLTAHDIRIMMGWGQTDTLVISWEESNHVS